MDERIIYRLNDQISFRRCSLANGEKTTYGDCTNFGEGEHNWRKYYCCNQDGIHLHCTKHPEIEFEIDNYYGTVKLKCPKCDEEIELDSFEETKKECLRMLNIPKFKDAALIRLDDWYFHEVKKREKTESGYWITTDVKTDRDGDTMVVVYVGYEGEKDKAQFFIKPEKHQLTSDHKDLDPAKIISKIEVTLRDRKLTHEFDS